MCDYKMPASEQGQNQWLDFWAWWFLEVQNSAKYFDVINYFFLIWDEVNYPYYLSVP